MSNSHIQVSFPPFDSLLDPLSRSAVGGEKQSCGSFEFHGNCDQALQMPCDGSMRALHGQMDGFKPLPLDELPGTSNTGQKTSAAEVRVKT
jgi:hypothetical protein